MKNLFTLSIICSVSALSLQAQTTKTVTKSQSEQQQSEINASDAKAKYISNQDYLSKTSLKNYSSFYGDSLNGFDEQGLKVDLLSNNVYGQEYINYMLILKRRYIYTKYKIGAGYTQQTLQTIPKPKTGKLIGGNNAINNAPCVNEDFELTPAGAYLGSGNANAIAGWVISSGANYCNPNTQEGMPQSFTAGSSEAWIRSTPIISVPFIGTLPNSPLGGTKVIQLNDQVANGNGLCTKITQTFPVTQANTLFQFAFAGAYLDGNHNCCSQPFLKIRMFDCLGAPLGCSSLSLNPPGLSCTVGGGTGYNSTPSPGGNVAWTTWQVKYIDLTPFIGTCVTLEVLTSDCSPTGHWASTYFDSRCGGQLIGTGLNGPPTPVAGPVSFCAGSNQAMISAPLGYSNYQWYGPGNMIAIAAPAGTMADLVIASPVPGAVYTVDMTLPSGCVFVSTNTLVFSQVNIAGTGSNSTCAGGASGSATVQGNGSGTGYNYVWTNASNNSVVGTSSVVNNLAAGVYSIVITGFGAAACGSAVSTVTVTTAPPGVTTLLKPFCSTQAYLGTAGGSGFQWFNNTTPIAAPLGTASNYTVNNPVPNSVITVTCMSNQGCRDSIEFTLIPSPPGFIVVTPPPLICPGGSNGFVEVNMSPAPGSPPGVNSYSVFSTGTTPAYSSSIFPTAANNYTAGGMQAGTYSVSAFDGSCKYGAIFSVSPILFNYALTPTSPTLCPGNAIAAGVNFIGSVPGFGQYTYSWSPSTWLAGNIQQSTIIQPVTSVGTQTTIIYTIIVTPTLVNCPIVKTLTITAVNPPTPTITPIQNLCNTFPPYQIVANPPGGSFLTGLPTALSPIGINSGILSPTLASLGTNTFVYSMSVNTCVATTIASYEVSQFNTSALTSSVPPICVTSSPFNLMNIVQNTVNGKWTGLGVQGNGTQFNPAPSGYPGGLSSGNYSIVYTTTSTPNPNTCPHSTQLNVAVTKTITPIITTVPEFCTNGALMNMTVSPSGGGWHNNPAVSSAGVITPTLAGIPCSVAYYTVNTGPCLNSATTTICASKFYPAGFSNTIANLCVTSNPVNLMSIVQNTVNGTWSGPPLYQSSIFSNSFSPTGLPTDVYVLTYHTESSPNPNLCQDTRTIAVSVLNPPMPVITAVGPYCNNGSPLQLMVTPNTGHWTSTPYLSSTGLFKPSFCSVGNNPIQYVIGTNTCNTQQTKFVSIEAFVPATIVTNIPDQCNTGSAVNLLPITLTNMGVWSGTGISGTSFNPATTGSGNFVLMHSTASSPSGLCPDQATIAVNVYSLAVPVVTKPGALCNSSAPFQLQVSPVGGLFGGANSGVVSQGGKFDPSSGFIGDNIINYSITAGPCVAYAQVTITVEKFVSADFAKELKKFCKPDEAVNMNSFVQNPGGTWSGPGIVGNMFNPSLANMGNNNIIHYKTQSIVYNTQSLPTTDLCFDTADVRIEVRDMPNVTALSNTLSGCSPMEVRFNTPSVQEGEGSWSLDDGSEPQTGLEISHIYTTPGVYHVTFSYSDPVGCSTHTTVSSPIMVYEVPKADFSVPEEILISNPEIQITNLTTILSNNTYQWKIGNQSEIYTDVHPKAEFKKIGKYTITLTATSVYGCKNELTKTIEVKNDFNIFIPTSFTPNYDGLNDFFGPVFSEFGLDQKSFEMEIFDRWGHSLYRTKDISKGWDGSVGNKGEPLKEEVYIYRIKYKDMDGNAYNKMGHVSLVK